MAPSFIFNMYALILDIWIWGLEEFYPKKENSAAQHKWEEWCSCLVSSSKADFRNITQGLNFPGISLYHSSFLVALLMSLQTQGLPHRLPSLSALDAFRQFPQGIPTGNSVRVCFLLRVTVCCPMQWEHELLRGELKAFRYTHQLLFTPPLCVSDLENCEEGWTKFQGHCYRHFEERETWMDAETRCRQHQAHLSSIITPEEQEFVNSEC